MLGVIGYDSQKLGEGENLKNSSERATEGCVNPSASRMQWNIIISCKNKNVYRIIVYRI
jgi:hypothetical protein